MKLDWRKHDRNAPESTYVRLAQPGDVLKFPGDNTLWQVEEVKERNSYVTVKFYNHSRPMTFAWRDRAKLWFRFSKPESVERLAV